MGWVGKGATTTTSNRIIIIESVQWRLMLLLAEFRGLCPPDCRLAGMPGGRTFLPIRLVVFIEDDDRTKLPGRPERRPAGTDDDGAGRRSCPVGRKQREHTDKVDASAPTVAIESVLLSCVVDAKEGRDVATVDTPGAFMQANMDETVHMRFKGQVAELLA